MTLVKYNTKKERMNLKKENILDKRSIGKYPYYWLTDYHMIQFIVIGKYM